MLFEICVATKFRDKLHETLPCVTPCLGLARNNNMFTYCYPLDQVEQIHLTGQISGPRCIHFPPNLISCIHLEPQSRLGVYTREPFSGTEKNPIYKLPAIRLNARTCFFFCPLRTHSIGPITAPKRASSNVA